MALAACGRRLLGPLTLVLLLVAVIGGCDRGSGEGIVSGQVLLDGKPLRGGTVTFVPVEAGTKSAGGPIDESGNYGPINVPAGEVLVSVDNRTLAPRQPGGPMPLPNNMNPEVRAKMMAARGAVKLPPPNPNYTPIPGLYYSADTSKLGFKVNRGEQKHDIELKSQ